MNNFIKRHPIISCFVGFVIIVGISVLLGWIIGGPAMAGRFASWVSGGYVFGTVIIIIEIAAEKAYKKKTGKSFQELVEQEEKNNRRKSVKKDDKNKDDHDDGL